MVSWNSIQPQRPSRFSDFSRPVLGCSSDSPKRTGSIIPVSYLMIGLSWRLRSWLSTLTFRPICRPLRPKASIHKIPILTRAMAVDLKTTPSPYEIERASSPYPNPYEQSPRSKILSQRTSNYHSSSLKTLHSSTMVSATVNKTSLHPGGVQ